MKQTTETRRFKGLLFGAAAGALVMFFLDPQRGRTRRALAQDKALRFGRRTRNRSERIAEDLRNRIYGKFQKIQHLRESSKVSNETLEQRVRSAIGRKVSHVKPIRVFVSEGEVVLTGPILTHEVKELLSAVESVPGVTRVIDELNKYDHPGNIPELQGEGPAYRQ
jgi:gas vesicle protein